MLRYPATSLFPSAAFGCTATGTRAATARCPTKRVHYFGLRDPARQQLLAPRRRVPGVSAAVNGGFLVRPNNYPMEVAAAAILVDDVNAHKGGLAVGAGPGRPEDVAGAAKLKPPDHGGARKGDLDDDGGQREGFGLHAWKKGFAQRRKGSRSLAFHRVNK